MTLEGSKAIASALGVNSPKRLKSLLRAHPEMPVTIEGDDRSRRYFADDGLLAEWRRLWLGQPRATSANPG